MTPDHLRQLMADAAEAKTYEQCVAADELEAAYPELAAWALEAAAALKKADPFLFNSPLEGSLDVWQIVNKARESFDRIGEP